jgi:hypothetical protein
MRRRSFIATLPLAAASPSLAADSPRAPAGQPAADPWTPADAAAVMELASISSRNVLVRGAGEIRSFGAAVEGLSRLLRFEGEVSLAHDPSRLFLPNNGADLLCSPGDVVTAVSRGGEGWIVTAYQPATLAAKLDRRGSHGARPWRYAIGGDGQTSAPDFALEGGFDRPKIIAKSAFFNDPGDTPEIGLLIADGTAAAPRPWTAPYLGAFIYGWPRDGAGSYGADMSRQGFADSQWLGRNAQITFALAETPTPTARGGALTFGVCPRGWQIPVDRGWFGPRGGFVLSGRATERAIADGRLKYPWSPPKGQEKYHPVPGLNWYDYQDDATLTLIASDTSDNKLISIRRDDDLKRGAGLDYVASSDELRLGRVTQGRFTAAWSWTARGDQAPAADRGADLGEPARRVRTVHADAIDVRRASKGPAAWLRSERPDHSGDVLTLSAAGAGGFNFLSAVAGEGAAAREAARIDADGRASTHGWSGSGSGYGEHMEWSDGNPDEEDRVGWTVVLEGGRIRRAAASDPAEAVIGVIAADANAAGAAAWSHWSGKYLCDDFGRPLVRSRPYLRWSEPVLETQAIQRARTLSERVLAPQRETREVVEETPQLLEIDGKWVQRTLRRRRLVERPLARSAPLHGEDGAPILDEHGRAVVAEVPVHAELEVERIEPYAEPAQVQLGEIQHCYPADAVPAGLVVPDHAERFVAHERVLNPEFDPEKPYLPRQARPEWDVVALAGQAKVRKGERAGARWIRIGEVSQAVERWLVR